jgi:site-specific DNA recombinase
MIKVIIYTRVSTDDQAKFGFSLRHQLEALTKFCDIKKYAVVKHFEDDYSAKTFDRPAFKSLEAYVKANKNDINLVLFTKWDRFSRNCGEALAKIKLFNSWGIVIDSSEQPLDLTVPENKLILAMYLMAPEIENDKNSQRTTDGSRKARKEGCWTGPAPFGYSNTRLLGSKSSLVPNEKSLLVKEVFKRLYTGLYTAEEIRKQLYNEGLKLQKQAFLNLIRNITYTGKILIKSYKNEDEQLVEGLHPAIVDEDVYYHVQKILDSRNRLKGKVKKKSDSFPLRGHLACNICGGNLTGSFSTSRNKDRHPYYHCQKRCKERFKAQDANKDFEVLLKKLEWNDEIAELYKETLKEIFHTKKGDKETQINKLQNEILETRQILESVDRKYYSDEITQEKYIIATDRYEGIIRDKLTSIEELKLQDTDTLKHFNYCLSLISNLTKHYNDCNIDVKNRFIGSIFPEKLVYSEKKYRTKNANSVFSLFTTVKADYPDLEIKKASISAGLPAKAPEAGLEPATL